MQEKIGKAAGTIWNYLKKNGTQSLTALANGTKLDKNLFQWAIGWLAREGKLNISKVKGKFEISLLD
ncbi:winged helix-turn-helix domain-containing protein [bacterium]|nr:winged helix-turn-helix domain-containing protein [bacterium]